MEWVNIGFDFRCPISEGSSWKVGDLGIEEFSELLGANNNKIYKIISFDLNLSPRPKSISSNQPGSVDMSYGAYFSSNEAHRKGASDEEQGILVFWQVEKSSYIKARGEGWFDFLPEDSPVLPDGWSCIGFDVINDQGVSEYWDISEEFWELDQRLIDSVSEYGLVVDEQLIVKYLPMLPLDPANKWVMILRVWIKTCRAGSANVSNCK